MNNKNNNKAPPFTIISITRTDVFGSSKGNHGVSA